MRHLVWSQRAYKALLKDQITFQIDRPKPLVIQSQRSLNFFRRRPENAAPDLVAELLSRLKYNRYTCPYILLTVVMNSKDAFPRQGGRCLNGGVNTGGGYVQLSSFVLDKAANVQSMLRHELGHAFGLPHVDVYGYDMKTNPSIMAYNASHETKAFRESGTPGKLIPEDLRLLALNQRVFPKLYFDRRVDISPGYALHEDIFYLNPMQIPNQPERIAVTTTSGEMFGSRVASIVQGRIKPSCADGSVRFDAATMWHSDVASSEWISVDLVFPMTVELTAIRVHSQHSGRYHAARAARILVQTDEGEWNEVRETVLTDIDERISFARTKGGMWRLQLAPGASKRVVVRGLQFYSGDDEAFPPMLVEPQIN